MGGETGERTNLLNELEHDEVCKHVAIEIAAHLRILDLEEKIRSEKRRREGRRGEGQRRGRAGEEMR